MTIAKDLVIVLDSQAPAGSCAVCGRSVDAVERVAARYEGHVLRFDCEACLSRFAADPGRYLDHGADSSNVTRGWSPASEWALE